MLTLLRSLTRKTRLFAVTVAALLLLGIIAGSGGLAFVAFLLTGSTGEHDAMMGADEEHFSLVLNHHQNDPRSPARPHQLLTQLVFALSEEGSDESGAHLLHFDRLQNALDQESRVAVAEPAARAPMICFWSKWSRRETAQPGRNILRDGETVLWAAPGLRELMVCLI